MKKLSTDTWLTILAIVISLITIMYACVLTYQMNCNDCDWPDNIIEIKLPDDIIDDTINEGDIIYLDGAVFLPYEEIETPVFETPVSEIPVLETPVLEEHADIEELIFEEPIKNNNEYIQINKNIVI